MIREMEGHAKKYSQLHLVAVSGKISTGTFESAAKYARRSCKGMAGGHYKKKVLKGHKWGVYWNWRKGKSRFTSLNSSLSVR